MDNEKGGTFSERQIAELHRRIQVDLDGVKREVLRRLHEIERSVEIIAREMVRRANRGADHETE